MTRKKMNLHLRQYRRTLLILFISGLLLILGFHLALPDQAFSAVENRSLKQRPAFTLTGFMDGSFQKQLGGYLEDQFPLRDRMIRIKAGMERLLQRQENNEVYIHAGDVLIDKFSPNPAALTSEKAQVINAFVKAHPTQKVSVMLVPTKVEILKDKLPPFAPTASQTDYLKEFYEQLSVKINKIDLIPRFSEQKARYLYFKSDHHWTQEGAFLAQEEYLKSIRLAPRTEGEYDIRKVSQDFLGTLTAKSGIAPDAPDDLNLYVPKVPEDLVVNLTEEQKKLTSLYQMDLVDGQDKYLTFLGGNYPVVRITTSSTNDRRLLIIKDSYANAFVPFVTKDFNEITMVDLRYYTGDVNALVDQYLITDVLILYNINTFNDDHSILNLGDGLEIDRIDETAPAIKPDTVTLSTSFDPYAEQQLKVTLRNNSKMELSYNRRVSLEIKQDGKWEKLTENPSYAWDTKLRTLGPSANAEFAVQLKNAFGILEPGQYRVVQTYNNSAQVAAEFTLEGNPLTNP